MLLGMLPVLPKHSRPQAQLPSKQKRWGSTLLSPSVACTEHAP